MVERVEITDEKSARAWLDEQDHQTQIWFAVRCSLRATPGLKDDQNEINEKLTITSLRANLISAAAVSSNQRLDEFKSVAAIAAHKAHYAADQASDSAMRSKRASLAHRDAELASYAAAYSAYTVFRSSSAVEKYAMHTARSGYGAASDDANRIKNWGALWRKSSEHAQALRKWEVLKAKWINDTEDWSFWIEWYEAILNGNTLPWELTQRIALEITEDEWDAGQAMVAQRIAEIRRQFESKPLDQGALQSHVQELVKNPLLNADIAESAGLQIEAAIQAFKREAPANQLPDGFEAFESLAPAFLSISATLSVSIGNAHNNAALQDEINRLHNVIAQLRADLRDARTRLSDRRLTALEVQQTRTFGERLQTTLTNITLLGTIGMGTAWFFGVPADELRYEALKNALQGLSIDMEDAQPAPEAPTLPEITDV